MSISLTDKNTTEAPSQPAPVVVTEKAAKQILIEINKAKEDMRSRGQPVPEKLYLRLRVVGGGCSGYQHKLDLDENVNPKLDEVFEAHGLEIIVDKRSLMYLNGAEVNYHDDLNRRGFSISNPMAKSTCGCGSSFSM